MMKDDGRPATAEVNLQRDRSRTRADGSRVGGYVPNRPGTVDENGVAVKLPARADIEAQMQTPRSLSVAVRPALAGSVSRSGSVELSS